MRRKKLGEVLQDRGHISAANLQNLFKEHASKMVRLGELILETGLVDKPSLVKALEDVSRVPYVDCAATRSDLDAAQLIPKFMGIQSDSTFEHCGQRLSGLFRFCPYCGASRELEDHIASPSSLDDTVRVMA